MMLCIGRRDTLLLHQKTELSTVMLIISDCLLLFLHFVDLCRTICFDPLEVVGDQVALFRERLGDAVQKAPVLGEQALCPMILSNALIRFLPIADTIKNTTSRGTKSVHGSKRKNRAAETALSSYVIFYSSSSNRYYPIALSKSFSIVSYEVKSASGS